MTAMSKFRAAGLPRRQQGATLIVGLVMLMVTVVSVLSLYNFSRMSLAVVQNMQNENVAVDAAAAALEAAISTTRIVNAPSAVFLEACDGVANSQCFDVDSDGSNDIVAQLTPNPFCVQAQIIQNSQLDLNDPADKPCITGSSTEFGVSGSVSNNSMCATSQWEVNVVANDALTETVQSVTGYYAVRVPTTSVQTSCPP